MTWIGPRTRTRTGRLKPVPRLLTLCAIYNERPQMAQALAYRELMGDDALARQFVGSRKMREAISRRIGVWLRALRAVA